MTDSNGQPIQPQPAQQPYPPAPQAAQPYPASQPYPPAPGGPAPATFPGKGLGIAGLIVGFFAPLVGLILSIVANSQSKKAGFKNTPAFVGIIISAVLMVVYAIILVLVVLSLFALSTSVYDQACVELGTGVWELADGTTITCD